MRSISHRNFIMKGANQDINRLIAAGGNFNALDQRARNNLTANLSPGQLSQYIKEQPAATPAAPASGGVDANALMEMYQKGLGADSGSGSTTTAPRSVADELALLQGQSNLESASKRQQTDDQLRLLREGNNLDLARKRVEQDMQMEGQKVALAQTQQARAKERETEAQLQRRQQSTERGNAMAAYRGL
jgi:hypothetical protein